MAPTAVVRALVARMIPAACSAGTIGGIGRTDHDADQGLDVGEDPQGRGDADADADADTVGDADADADGREPARNTGD